MKTPFNILIVEDNANKVESIKNLLRELEIDLQVVVMCDYVLTPAEAITLLKKNKYTFLILDMSLPAYSEESHTIGSLSGKQILQTMKHKKINVPTVILTQWDIFGHHENTISLEGLRDELLEKFKKILLGVVFWDSANESWKDDMACFIKGVIND